MIWLVLLAIPMWFVVGAWSCAMLEELAPGWNAWYDEGKQRFGDFLFPAVFLAMWPVWWVLYWRA